MRERSERRLLAATAAAAESHQGPEDPTASDNNEELIVVFGERPRRWSSPAASDVANGTTTASFEDLTRIEESLSAGIDEASLAEELLSDGTSDTTTLEPAHNDVEERVVRVGECRVDADDGSDAGGSRLSEAASREMKGALKCAEQLALSSSSLPTRQPATTETESFDNTAGAAVMEEPLATPVAEETSSATTVATTTPPPPNPQESTDAPTADEAANEETANHFDVSQHLYDGVKNVWGFGCDIALVRPLFKATENVAGTILDATTGIDLGNGDEEIKPKLAQLDNELVNPMIGNVVGAVAPLFAKGEEIVRPVVTAVGPVVLGPFGLMKGPCGDDDEMNGEEMTSTEVTAVDEVSAEKDE
eukprot:CAMPEP_0172501374 /NCGR_PEP_ID=MMETSP1066-20121228/149211_1 /TAXON_ID=671091 /ORGANISM="Coscinodiscus wailesii, Strain CCMP2513" /LENGTH=362 /DNA_ID=CAMNT_0013276129 /DNA_START=265 /DNA_END=1353 /DNA_ORIENTATION=-